VFAFFAFDTALSLTVGVSLWERFVTGASSVLAPLLDVAAGVLPTALAL
jgi:hypothetical protein